MLASLHTYPQFKPIIEEWKVYLLLSESDAKLNNLTGEKKKEVWKGLDKSLPIILPNGDSFDTYFIRVLYHHTKGICLDIRKVKKIENELTLDYIPTDIGITLPLKQWKSILNPMLKLIRKWIHRI